MLTPSISICNIEYEKFVIGAMLLKDGVIVPDVAAILSAEDFYRPEHRIVFNDILKVYAQNQPVNLMTLIELMRNNGDLEKINMECIFMFTEIAHTTAYAPYYAKVIKEKSDLRKLTNIAQKIIATAEEGITSPIDIISSVNNEFLNLSESTKEEFSTVGKYLASDFLKHFEKHKKYNDRKTGFSNIDAVQLFEPGLYILGATPACGKTTFAWQLLEQLSETGEHCIFCSYEMPKDDLVAKTAARKLFLYDQHSTLTASDILRGGWNSALLGIIDEALDNENFIVREFSNENVDKLIAILRPIVNSYDKPPIVCIDYLQRLIPRDGKTADTRSLIDDALFKLKDFSKHTDTTFIVVSTFNRTNYNQLVDFEAFKESGGIEYTADVVWALQLDVANKLSGEKQEVIRKKINDAKKEQPRHINLKCLKNRKGNIYDCFFQYFSAHDFFQPCNEEDFIINALLESVDNSDKANPDEEDE